jgi:hypothetical protein
MLYAAALWLFAQDPACTVWFAAEAASPTAVRVRAEAEVEGPVDDVLAALEDFSHYPEYMPRVRRAERRRGGVVYTEIVSPWPLKDVWFEAQVKRESVADGYLLSWRLVRGNIRRNDGVWRLTALAPERTRLRYEGTVELYHFIPPPLLRLVEQHELPLVVQAIRRRALKGAAPRCASTVTGEL